MAFTIVIHRINREEKVCVGRSECVAAFAGWWMVDVVGGCVVLGVGCGSGRNNIAKTAVSVGSLRQDENSAFVK